VVHARHAGRARLARVLGTQHAGRAKGDVTPHAIGAGASRVVRKRQGSARAQHAGGADGGDYIDAPRTSTAAAGVGAIDAGQRGTGRRIAEDAGGVAKALHAVRAALAREGVHRADAAGHSQAVASAHFIPAAQCGRAGGAARAAWAAGTLRAGVPDRTPWTSVPDRTLRAGVPNRTGRAIRAGRAGRSLREGLTVPVAVGVDHQAPVGH